MKLEQITNAIAKAEAAITAKNFSPEKIAESSKALDMQLDEYVAFQELKSVASIDGTMTLEAAQFVYGKLGNTVEHFNSQPLAVKWVMTELLSNLLGKRIAARR